MTLEIPETHALDEGIYPAKLVKLETKTTEAGTFRIWSFDVAANGQTEKITAASSLMLGPKSKAYKWVSSLIGRRPIPGEKLEIIGAPCQLHLIVDEDSGYNKVEAVLPPGNATAASLASALPAPAPMVKESNNPDDPNWLPPLEEPPVERFEG